MPPRPNQYFCVHSHFYQPARGNPLTGEIGVESDAGKYRNWNERITAESYRPNAEIGNFDQISFDVGEALMSWLKKRAPETYQRIIHADRLHLQRKKTGNAIANPYHDVLLPLRKRADKHTELYWGRHAFYHHYGREPLGVWLPEMSVDLETLQVAESLGYKYTILAQGQVRGALDGGGPYWVDLQNGRQIAVFVRNDELSADLSFNIQAVGGAGYWARNRLAERRTSKGALTLVATDGETFGHHHLGEERFLHWLLTHEAPSVGFRIVTLNEYLQIAPPVTTVEVKPFSSWNERFSVRQWATGSDAWKAMFMRALDYLASEINDLYRDEVRPLGVDPVDLREAYIRVWLGEMAGPELLAEAAPGLKSDQEARILDLLQAWMYISKAYSCNAFFVDDPDMKQPRYAVGNALYAIQIVAAATGVNLSWNFRNDLFMVKSHTTANPDASQLTGSQLYDDVYEEYFAPPAEQTDAVEPEALPEA